MEIEKPSGITNIWESKAHIGFKIYVDYFWKTSTYEFLLLWATIGLFREGDSNQEQKKCLQGKEAQTHGNQGEEIAKKERQQDH